MKIKNNSVCLATVVLVLAGGLPLTAVAHEVVEMDMRFAGTGALRILHVDPTTGLIATSGLNHLQAKGSPGTAEVRGFGGRTTSPGLPVTTCLGSPGLFLSFTIVEVPLVFTFKDLSLLFASGGGTLCFNQVTLLVEFEANIMFMGGRGKFEGATGQAVIRGEAEAVSNDFSFVGQTGTIIGTILVPDA